MQNPAGTESLLKLMPPPNNATAPEREKRCGKSDRIYPCSDCGVLRSEEEGGKIFTVCDDCWHKAYPEYAELP